jgi:hypothetical protein
MIPALSVLVLAALMGTSPLKVARVPTRSAATLAAAFPDAPKKCEPASVSLRVVPNDAEAQVPDCTDDACDCDVRYFDKCCTERGCWDNYYCHCIGRKGTPGSQTDVLHVFEELGFAGPSAP